MNEFHKKIDLECTDGIYDDTGYPAKRPNAISGRDNLYLWAKHDSSYILVHNGNIFDNTDVFDGFKFTSFTPYTNPNSNGYGIENQDKQTNVSHLAITNIRPGGICNISFKFSEMVT